jgi:thiamine-phosphate pyrophosphorylase
VGCIIQKFCIDKDSKVNKSFNRDLYVISDDADVLIKAVRDGAGIIQLRDKSGNRETIIGKAKAIMQLKHERAFKFILNDDPALAFELGADGVHVGQDMSTSETRNIIGPSMILGKTTHNVAQGLEAIREGADYISVGPVYATPTKPGRPAVGLAYVREAVQKLDIPFVAIGGIDLDNIDDVLAAGAKTIGIVRAAGDATVMLQKIRNNRA